MTTARVKLNVYATLRRYIGGAPSIELQITPGQTIRQVLQQQGIPPDQTRIIFVDSRAASLSQPLQGGERIGVFPAIGGG